MIETAWSAYFDMTLRDIVIYTFLIVLFLLRPGGLFVVEHADVQGVSVPLLLGAGPDGSAGWSEVTDHQDLAGRDRYCTARRSGSGATGATR